MLSQFINNKKFNSLLVCVVLSAASLHGKDNTNTAANNKQLDDNIVTFTKKATMLNGNINAIVGLIVAVAGSMTCDEEDRVKFLGLAFTVLVNRELSKLSYKSDYKIVNWHENNWKQNVAALFGLLETTEFSLKTLALSRKLLLL